MESDKYKKKVLQIGYIMCMPTNVGVQREKGILGFHSKKNNLKMMGSAHNHYLENNRFYILNNNCAQVRLSNRAKELGFKYWGASSKNQFMRADLLITYLESYIAANAAPEELLEAMDHVRRWNVNLHILWCFKTVFDNTHSAVQY
jgi:hypothetical protein